MLTSNSVVKRLLSKMACLIGRVEDFVVKDGKVQGKTETDGVGRSEIGGRDLSGSFISLQRLIGRDLTLVAKSEFSEVAVIVTLPITQILAERCTCS